MLSCRTGLLTEACEHRKGTVEVFLTRIVLAGGKGQRGMGGGRGPAFTRPGACFDSLAEGDNGVCKIVCT